MYYGANLDALYDCLTEIVEPTQIIVPADITDNEKLGWYGEIVITYEDSLEEKMEERLPLSLYVSEAYNPDMYPGEGDPNGMIDTMGGMIDTMGAIAPSVAATTMIAPSI